MIFIEVKNIFETKVIDQPHYQKKKNPGYHDVEM